MLRLVVRIRLDCVNRRAGISRKNVTDEIVVIHSTQSIDEAVITAGRKIKRWVR